MLLTSSGVFPKLIHSLDELSLMSFKRTATIKTKEDVRNLTDDLIVAMANAYDSENFGRGFWGRGDGGGLKGHETTALCRLLPFAYAGCDVLMGDTGRRTRILDATWSMLMLLSEFETEQFYLESELDELHQRVLRVFKAMHFLMDELTSADGTCHGPGHVFDILKAHMLGGAVKFIRRFGSLRTIDTESGERSMKDAKLFDRLVTHDTHALLRRLCSLQSDHARRTTAGSVTTRHRVLPPDSRGTSRQLPTLRAGGLAFESLEEFDSLVQGLKTGAYGPAVPDGVIESCDGVMRRSLELGMHEKIRFDIQAAAPCVAGDVSYLVLRAGHCVQLQSGDYAQILIPRITRVRECTIPLGGRPDRVDSLMSIFTFVRPDVRGGFYPELPVPWLRRSDVRVIPLEQVTRRVHLVLLFGDAHRARNDYAQHFLLNTTADPCYGGPANRIVYLRCAISTCSGLLPRPRVQSLDVRTICPMCSFPQAWI